MTETSQLSSVAKAAFLTLQTSDPNDKAAEG